MLSRSSIGGAGRNIIIIRTKCHEFGLDPVGLPKSMRVLAETSPIYEFVKSAADQIYIHTDTYKKYNFVWILFLKYHL